MFVLTAQCPIIFTPIIVVAFESPKCLLVLRDHRLNTKFLIPTLTFNASTMASILKAQTANASKAEAKRKGKRKADDMDVDEEHDIVPPKKHKNKQRVLLLSSRGITHRMRHLMNDLEALLPHVKKGAFSTVSPLEQLRSSTMP
jgi:hypothetical protein